MLEVHGPLGQPHRRPRPVCAPERVIYEMEVVGDLEAINEDIRVRQENARSDPDLLDFEWFLTPDGRLLTLLCTYADVLAQQRSFVRLARRRPVVRRRGDGVAAGVLSTPSRPPRAGP